MEANFKSRWPSRHVPAYLGNDTPGKAVLYIPRLGLKEVNLLWSVRQIVTRENWDLQRLTCKWADINFSAQTATRV
jgi:hypothetical protein